MKQGDTVKLTHPENEAERNARYVVVEMRETRVVIELVCDLPIRPQECVAIGEVELVS